ncbi:MAG: class I SAM-dependent RNA methyltransferase, partial [Flavobacteriales bacterium]
MKKNNEDTLYIAKTFAGLEDVLAGELTSQGADAVSKMKRAVSFRGDKRLLYTANLKLRTALRILKPIFTCRAKDEDALYGQCKEFEWERLLDIEQTFAVDSVVFSEYFKHSKYAALKLKDAIADRFRQRVGKRPSVDTLNPGIRIHLHISADRINVSLDSSGDSLHKRGYRDTRHIAPMNEALAAGVLKVSNWTGTLPLIDPMCGSGTIPFEAAMLAAGIPPGIRRSTYGFMHWNDFDEQLWREVREEALAQARTPGVEIIAADASAKSLDIARSSAIRFGLNHLIKF